MKAQSYCYDTGRNLLTMHKTGKTYPVKIYTHSNKSKKYPYSSTRQNNRKNKYV